MCRRSLRLLTTSDESSSSAFLIPGDAKGVLPPTRVGLTTTTTTTTLWSPFNTVSQTTTTTTVINAAAAAPCPSFGPCPSVRPSVRPSVCRRERDDGSRGVLLDAEGHCFDWESIDWSTVHHPVLFPSFFSFCRRPVLLPRPPLSCVSLSRPVDLDEPSTDDHTRDSIGFRCSPDRQVSSVSSMCAVTPSLPRAVGSVSRSSSSPRRVSRRVVATALLLDPPTSAISLRRSENPGFFRPPPPSNRRRSLRCPVATSDASISKFPFHPVHPPSPSSGRTKQTCVWAMSDGADSTTRTEGRRRVEDDNTRQEDCCW